MTDSLLLPTSLSLFIIYMIPKGMKLFLLRNLWYYVMFIFCIVIATFIYLLELKLRYIYHILSITHSFLQLRNVILRNIFSSSLSRNADHYLEVDNDKHQLYQVLNYRPMTILNIISLRPFCDEFLVCYSSFGIYISIDSKNRSRQGTD